MNKKINNFVKTLGNISLEVYDQLGGLNFDEKDFQIALGYEFSKKRIDYLRETHIELFYKDLPIKLGAPDFFVNNEKPPLIIEVKLANEINHAARRQLKMYLVSIKRTPKSVIKNVDHGIILNFLKGESVSIFDEENKGKKKQLHKIQVERYILDKNENLKLLDKLNLEPIYNLD
tara:strand:+ start:70 stop:594 length:525 start_codon:yes stop_codon:yes gene_type:complete